MNRLIFTTNRTFFSFISKQFSTNCIYKEDYVVSPFCSLFVTCPFNVKIRPLDVHKYPNCDKIIISLYSNKPKANANITCLQDKSKFNIFGESNDKEIIDCYIETPVKSDINILTTGKGKIDIKKLNGDKIILHSELGDIISENCQTSKINFSSNKGNITTLGTLHAAEIKLQAYQKAIIDVNHLQALKAKVLSENGDIKIKSSYCDETVVESKTGKLYLDNLHKNCSITITENGLLQMTGFDGTLNANIMAGDIDIQISKLYDQSKIIAKEKCSFLLRLSEWVQNNTKIITDCQQLKVPDDVIVSVKNDNNRVILSPKFSESTSELDIQANLSFIEIESASWSDMLKLKEAQDKIIIKKNQQYEIFKEVKKKLFG